jgi:hypothetical protein
VKYPLFLVVFLAVTFNTTAVAFKGILDIFEAFKVIVSL